jgi:hypothetical protein
MLPCLSVNPARSMTLLAKSTIRPEDAWNPVRHLGSERGFPPSVAVQIAALEFANSVVLWCHPNRLVELLCLCCPLGQEEC